MTSRKDKRTASEARGQARTWVPTANDPDTSDAASCERQVPCDPTALAEYNSYGTPDFVERGYYEDRPFDCVDCGKPQVWWAARQKWWFEVAKGYPYSTAVRCAPCRERARTELAEARATSQAGAANKRGDAPD